ncbi:hypothetical protein ACIP2Z_39250 [Streptomyces iakyrus]|uniref:Uncharacterized protein n=1 Tax=Streptomyces iakyrus TaxID=68219 RepID=A0ABW8FS93_9ACTN
MAETQKTGIKNADELIALADAFGLTVTVETTDRETLTSYVVRFAIPVPVAYAGTELGRTIAGDTITLLWTKAKKKGARGCLVDATVWSVVSHRKVRTLREVDAAVRTLGHSSAKYARDAAPLPEDVVDAPHALYINGELRREGIPAERVRTYVKNRRFAGRLTHQDADGAIICDTRRYAPMPSAPAEETPAPAEERMHVRIANGGTPELLESRDALEEINHAMMDGKRDVREMSEGRGNARIVYRDQRGTVTLRRATAEDIAAYAPAPEPAAPVEAAPLFAALAAYEATVLCTSPRDLDDLARHLHAVGKAAPTAHHREVLEAEADVVEGAWESLRTAGNLRARNAANDKARAAVERARAAILAVAPHAHRMHGTDLPSTAEEIRAAAVAYNAVGSTPEELSAVETGTPQVRVRCSSDSGTGRKVTATITAGVDTPQGFLPAHPAIVETFHRRDGREDAAANARKVIGALFRVAVPVEYVRKSRG